MPDDYMADAEEMEAPVEETKDASETKTALVPTSVLGEPKPKPGDTCTFKVTKCFEDECQIEYLSRGSDSKSETDGVSEQLEGMEDML